MYLTESELKQLDLLKKRDPSDRFLLMIQLIGGQIEAMKAGIKHKNPTMSEEKLEKEFRDQMLRIYSIKNKRGINDL